MINRGSAKVTLPITLTHPFVDRFVEIPPHDMNVLSYFRKDDGEARILTEGNPFLPGNFHILKELTKMIFSRRRLLNLKSLLICGNNILLQDRIGFNT